MAIEGHREDLISENHGTPLSTRRIPPELFRPIIEHLEHRPTLLALSVTSRILRADAERQLYSVLDDGSDVPQHIAFLSTINQNPRLAGLVQVYHSINIVHYKENPLWDLLYSGLRKMTNLKVFHFRAFGGHPAAELLLDSPFQLEGLHWANHSEGEIMSQFLVQQHSLRHLYLESKRGRTYSSACCPNLTSLGGNRITLESFLPGRRITEVSWVPELQDFNNDPMIHLDLELGRLRTLSFGGYFSRPHFCMVVDHLHSLQKLELVGLLSDELMLIKGLKNLQELVFSFKWGSNHLPIPLEDRESLVQDLFSMCQHLICVDIAYEWTMVTEIWYQRWTRGPTQCLSSLVTLMEVRCGRFGGKEVRVRYNSPHE